MLLTVKLQTEARSHIYAGSQTRLEIKVTNTDRSQVLVKEIEAESQIQDGEICVLLTIEIHQKMHLHGIYVARI